MYNYNHLFYFYVTAKSGGVTNAAKHLRLSQPSLSSQLKILEQSLDVKLFNKVGRKNELTETGETIYSYCRKMFGFADEMGELISKRMPIAKKRLNIGISEEINRSFVVEVVGQFLKQFGSKRRPQITLVSGTREQLNDKLRFKELDLLVSDLATIDSELNKIAYAEMPVVLTCSNNLHTQFSDVINSNIDTIEAIRTMSNNENIQWIMPSNKLKLKSEIDNFFESNDIKSQIAFETDSTSSLIRAVKDDIGFTFLPLQYISQEVQNNSMQVIGEKEGHWKYRIWLVSQQQNRNDELIKSFAKSFNETCRA
jgi:LysR family transcriptional activator of nhaA